MAEDCPTNTKEHRILSHSQKLAEPPDKPCHNDDDGEMGNLCRVKDHRVGVLRGDYQDDRSDTGMREPHKDLEP